MTLILPQLAGGTSYPYTLTNPKFVQNKALTYKTANGLDFKPDGTKFYIATNGGTNPDIVEEWTCSTAWDISTATVSHTYTASGWIAGVAMMNDGADIAWIDGHNKQLEKLGLSTDYDLSTHDGGTIGDITPTGARGLFIRDNAEDFYFVDTPNDEVEQWSMSTAGDINTASFVRALATGLAVPRGVCFDPTGTIMMVTDNTTDSVYQYNLSTAWDISTAVSSGLSFNTDTDGGGEKGPLGVVFGNGGKNLYITGFTNQLTQISL